MKRLAFSIALLAILLAGTAGASEVVLTVTKDGSDILLTWTGGTGPFSVLRARHATMTTRLVTDSTGATSPATLTGKATDGIKNYFFSVNSSTAPTITITSPADGFTTNRPYVSPTGTYAGATAIYANTFALPFSGGAWSTPVQRYRHVSVAKGVPISIGNNIHVYACARNAESDWACDSVSGSYTATGLNNESGLIRKEGY